MSTHDDEDSRSQLPVASSFSRSLRLLVREDEECDNLFVRLSVGVASDLVSLRRRQPQNELSAAHPKESKDAWTLPEEEASNGSISFLPLCISFGGNATIFGSFNGGICVSSSDQDTIEVPRSLIPVAPGDICGSSSEQEIPEVVSVYALSFIDYSERVLVEPATVQDWELLEVYSNLMEEGGLLNQVSVTYPGQHISIRVGGIDRVNVRVKEISTRDPGDDTNTIWPDMSTYGSDSSEHSKTTNTSPQCVLLIQDTEMIVEPKARPRKNVSAWLDPFQLIPSDLEWGSSLKKLSSLSGRGSLHVDPGCVHVRTEQWQFETEWAQIRSEDSKKTRVVRVMTSSRIPRNNAVLYLGTRLDLNAPIHQCCIFLRPLPYTRQESVEEIILEEIRLEHDRRSFAVWNVPNIELADSFQEMKTSACRYQEDPVSFPVGAVIRMPSPADSSEGTTRVDRWFRITSKEASSDGTALCVRLGLKDIITLLKGRLRKRKEMQDTLAIPEISTIQRPQKIISSSDWTKSIIDRMKHFSSIFVTLSGASGSGKTYNALLLSTLASFNFHRPTYYLDCKKLQKSKSRMSEILEEIDSLFTRAAETGDCLLVLDDLDILSPNLLGGDENDASERTHTVNPAAIDQAKLISDRLSNLLTAVQLQGTDIGGGQFFLVVTCSSADSINPSLLKSSRAPLIHAKVPLLSSEDRSDLLVEMIRRLNPQSRLNLDRSDISRRTEGFAPRDFEKLSLRALRSCRTNATTGSLQDSLVAELADYTPIAQMSNLKDQDQLSISWTDIGGLFEVKEALESIVRQPQLYRRIYARTRMQLPRGIMLYGPSGCGKSFVVPALARLCNYPLITCKGPEVLDKYIGASEAKVRALFERASQMAPSILFLDELEALAPRRGSDSTGVTDRVVNQLLTFLDGVEDVSSGTVFIIGATSRPDKVDPAIIRPGRLERHLYIGPPTCSKEWSDLMITIAKNWNLKAESLNYLSTSEELMNMVMNTPRLCPADVRAAFDTAHLNAVHRTLREDILAEDIKKIEIGIEDMIFGLGETNPSLSESEARNLEFVYNSFRGDRSNVNSDSKIKLRELKTSLR